MMTRSSATASAPASVANVAVGFDILGFAFPLLFDRVSVTRIDARETQLESMTGLGRTWTLTADQNTATVAVEALRVALELPFGFRVRVEKGIPLSAGLGGSAASAVAAVVAANALLDSPLAQDRLCHFATLGERVASGAYHADNTASSLYGGLILVASHDPLTVSELPVPPELHATVVHPALQLETQAARAALSPTLDPSRCTVAMRNLAAIIDCCHRGQVAELSHFLTDEWIEPQRAPLIHEFASVKRAGLEAGALGVSIAGAGPSIFGWSASANVAAGIQEAMSEAWRVTGVSCEGWSLELSGARGAALEE